jgi:uncharacterized protein YkwD
VRDRFRLHGLVCFWGLIVACGLALSSSAGAASATVDAERELVRLMNQERAQRGAPPLEMDDRLSEAARTHSQEMAQRQKLSHRFPHEEKLQERLARTGVSFDAVAENVAHSSSPSSAHIELMNSPGHRANILNPKYNAVGVGVVERGDHLYITQAFARRLPEYRAEDIESRVFNAFNRLRKQNGQPTVRRAEVKRLREFACEGEVSANQALRRFGGASSAVVFTGSNPDELPSQMQRVAGQPWSGSIALGACPPANTQSNFAMFRVVALFTR